MANVVVVGAQWGDEGKGKIVDWLSERADVVVRFQGGHNAGHTLVIDQEIFKKHPHWLFNHVSALNEDNTLIMYYENNDEYKPHRDLARLTGITWFYREPKKFTGGNLRFPRFDMEIECKHNRVIVFPSSIHHGVDKVGMEEKDMGKKLGRFTMTQFLSCVDYQRL